MIYDSIVIGAGIEGSSTAYYLVSNGEKKSVLLLEQFDALHTRGSSHGGSRIGHNAYHEPFYVNMMNPCYEMWRDIERKSGKELYVETGVLSFGYPKPIQEYSLALTKNGVNHQILSSAEINASYSEQLKIPEDYLGIYAKPAGLIRAGRSVATLQNLFVQNGGTFLDRHEVTGIIPGQMIQVETNRGTFMSRKVIVTAGAWTNKVLEKTNLTLPLRPIRTEALYWSAINPDAYSHKKFPVFLYVNDEGYFDYYGLPADEYKGLARIAFHFGQEVANPELRDTVVSQGFTSKSVSEFIQKHFKGLQDTPSIIETCMYTATPDLHPIIDVHPIYPNIVIATGFSGKGFKFGPIVGKIVSELSEGKTPCVDVSDLWIKRFNAPKANL